MPDSRREIITERLREWSDGQAAALDELWPAVYDHLRDLAGRQLARERRNHTLQPTAVVHEAYLRLVDQTQVRWTDRNHFFAVAATMMRRILVDYARQRQRAKRGAGAERLTLEAAGELSVDRPLDLVAVDEALRDLEKVDPRKASIVELRFFAGLSCRETAEVLGCSEKTVLRQWSFTKMWLCRELTRGAAGGT